VQGEGEAALVVVVIAHRSRSRSSPAAVRQWSMVDAAKKNGF
jgi:hypothetical protein